MTLRARWMTGILLAWSALLVLALSVLILRSTPPDDDPRAPESPLSRLEDLRDAADRCADQLAQEQARFHAHEQQVDSLRALVLEYESEERTVPAEAFEPYLEAFNAYNEAVELWHERAAALQQQDQACRALIERHNALVDSLSASPRPGSGNGEAAAAGHTLP